MEGVPLGYQPALCIAAGSRFQDKRYEAHAVGRKCRGTVGNCDIALYYNKGTASGQGGGSFIYSG